MSHILICESLLYNAISFFFVSNRSSFKWRFSPIHDNKYEECLYTETEKFPSVYFIISPLFYDFLRLTLPAFFLCLFLHNWNGKYKNHSRGVKISRGKAIKSAIPLGDMKEFNECWENLLLDLSLIAFHIFICLVLTSFRIKNILIFLCWMWESDLNLWICDVLWLQIRMGELLLWDEAFHCCHTS